MADYTGGYTSAVNSASQRDQQAAWIQQALQQMAHQKWLQQQLEQQDADRKRDATSAGRILLDQSQQQPPVQPPMPGQASVPMQPPMPTPGPAMQQFGAAMGGAPPPASPMAMTGGPGMAPPGAQPQPQGWRPSPAMGGPPAQAGAPAPGATPPLATPPGAPPPPAALGGAGMPSAGQGGWVKNAMQSMVKQGIPAEQAIGVLEQMRPAMESQNRQEIADMRLQLGAQAAAIREYKAYIDAHREERISTGTTPTATGRNAVAAGMEPGSPEYQAAMRAKVEKDTAMPGAAGAAAGYGKNYDALEPEKQKVVDWYSLMDLSGDRTWRTGLSRQTKGASIIAAVDERVPALAGDLGLSAGDVGTQKAIRTASQAALTQLTKDVTSIEPFGKMMDQNADILKGLATKIIKTDSALANKPINWIGKNVTGNPDVAEFMAQMRLVQTEASRVITNPRLVGQLTDSARHELEDILNGEMSLGATNRVIDRLKNDSERRIGLMKQQQSGLEQRIREMTPGQKKTGGDPALKRTDGATLMVDKNGNRAYVKDGKVVEMVP